jgi:hypothetical protein
MVVTEGNIYDTKGWDKEDLRHRRTFFLYDLLFAGAGALYLSQMLKGWAQLALLVYAALHFLGHGFYIAAWNSGSKPMESVLEWSVTHPSQRALHDTPFWNSFNEIGTYADLGLHATIAVLAAYFLLRAQ